MRQFHVSLARFQEKAEEKAEEKDEEKSEEKPVSSSSLF